MRSPAPFRKRIISFVHAFNGIKVLFNEEFNARIHALAALNVIGLGIYFHISAIEWIICLLCIAAVFSAELFNSAIENVCDAISLEKNQLIGKAKDLAAAGVLVCALGAFLAGSIIFTPKILNRLQIVF